jgi:UPF0755 protein
MRLKILLILLGLVILLLATGALFLWKLNQPIAASGKVEFLISSGESVQEIGDKIQEAGVMNSLLFVYYVRFKNLTSRIQAGRYDIPLTLTPIQVVELLQHGTFDVRLTFLEGWRREEYLRYALANLAVDDEDFSTQFLVATEDLEGYLFPDTYLAPIDIGAPELVALLNQNFENKYQETVLPLQSKSGLTKKQVVILASLLERESIGDQEELETIAGIMIKRWKSGWYLGIDATIQYLLGYQKDTGSWWTKNESKIVAGKKIDSPYNTYTHLGIPSAPIANPGINALLAVVNYQKSPYWYYLHCKNGEIRYAKDLGGHDANKSCLRD